MEVRVLCTVMRVHGWRTVRVDIGRESRLKGWIWCRPLLLESGMTVSKRVRC